jgi:hypothetical protein
MEITNNRTWTPDYKPGQLYGICDRCGFKFRHRELRKEWTGLMVCAEDFDPRPADLDPPMVVAEGLPIRDARPDPGDVLGPNTTTREDL